MEKYLRVAGSSTPISRLLIMKSERGSSKNRYSNGCRARQPSAIGDPVLNVCPKQPTQRMWRWERKHSDRDCSRFARQESCCQQRPEPPGTQLHANQDWTSVEVDRKRGKKRGLTAVRGKVTPAPGGCNQKGATG